MTINWVDVVFADFTSGNLVIAGVSIVLGIIVWIYWKPIGNQGEGEKPIENEKEVSTKKSWRGGSISSEGNGMTRFKRDGTRVARRFMTMKIREKVNGPQDVLDFRSFQVLCISFFDRFEFSDLRNRMMEEFGYCPDNFDSFCDEIEPESPPIVRRSSGTLSVSPFLNSLSAGGADSVFEEEEDLGLASVTGSDEKLRIVKD